MGATRIPDMLLLPLPISTKLSTIILLRTVPIRHILLLHLAQHDHLIAVLARSAVLSPLSAGRCGSTFPDAGLNDEDEEEDGDGYGGVDEDDWSGLP